MNKSNTQCTARCTHAFQTLVLAISAVINRLVNRQTTVRKDNAKCWNCYRLGLSGVLKLVIII